MLKIKKNIHIHFVGIGGIGMSGIAEILLSLGQTVSGSDMSNSSNTDKLESLGAKIFIGHSPENVSEATLVVYSSAITESNPEIVAAKNRSIPIMRRLEMLAELMRLKQGLAVAGTHGKTTTSSILATILQECNLDPTYIIGGIVENLKGHAKTGKGEFLIAETDESDGSFLHLNPFMSIITNVDNDHLDFYKTEDNLHQAFLDFANNVPFYGCTALNIHDPILMEIKNKMKKPWITYGIADNKNIAEFEARDIVYSSFQTTYSLYHNGTQQTEITLNLPGKHNVLNSLGAIVLAAQVGLKFDQIAKAIGKFKGVSRRYQLIYSFKNLDIVEDYAHHPTEIIATLQATKNNFEKDNLLVVFEPHRYTRTEDCWNDFLHCFNLADKLYLLPIYPASEEPIASISSERLSLDINKLHPSFCSYIDDIQDVDTVIKNNKSKKTTILVLGAGSIGQNVRKLLERH